MLICFVRNREVCHDIMTMHNSPYPGETLSEYVLSALGLSVTKAAAQLGVTRAVFSRVLNGRAALSPEMALRLERWLGTEHHIAAVPKWD